MPRRRDGAYYLFHDYDLRAVCANQREQMKKAIESADGSRRPILIDGNWWRRRESNPRPRVHPRGTLHACPLLLSRPGVRKRQKPPGTSLGIISRSDAEAPSDHQPV